MSLLVVLNLLHAHEFPTNLWSTELSTTLDDISWKVYQHLDIYEREYSECFINALRRRFGRTAGSYREQLHIAKPYKFERVADQIEALS